MFGVPEDNVFLEDISRGRGYDYRVRVVEDGVTPESFEQPSSYSAMDADRVLDIDEDQKLAKEEFSDTQNGVLENYYKIQDEFIPRVEKETLVKPEKITDDNGHTWWEIDPKDLKKTAFGFTILSTGALGKALINKKEE